MPLIETHRVFFWPVPLWRSINIKDDGSWTHVRYGRTPEQSHSRCLLSVAEGVS